jgi:phosphotransferase system IIA component
MSTTEGQTEFETRKRLHEEIKKFNRTEQEELFRILKRENEEVSENRNGIFFDLTVIKESTLNKIKEWIVFCKKNTTDFEEREKEIELLTKGQEDQEDR